MKNTNTTITDKVAQAIQKIESQEKSISVLVTCMISEDGTIIIDEEDMRLRFEIKLDRLKKYFNN